MSDAQSQTAAVPGLGWPLAGPSATSDEASGVAPEAGLGWPASPGDMAERAGEEASAVDESPTEAASGPYGPGSAHQRRGSARPGVSRETTGLPSPAPDAASTADTSENSQQDAAQPSTVSRETDDPPLARATETALRAEGRRSGDDFAKPISRRIITVANQKGGVGKTTSTVNIAAAMALYGLRVLVIDLDPQGNASTALGIDHRSEVPSVYDALVDGKALSEIVQPVEGIPGLVCVPATIDLAGAEIELVSLVARESRLRRSLTAYLDGDGADLDYVFIDCPPSLGLLTVNALVAAAEVLIPIQCEYYALEGLGQLLKNIELVQAHLHPELEVSTILLTMYDARTRLAAQVADEVRGHFGDRVLRSVIPRSVRVSEAPSYGQTVMTYDPASTGALCYLDAARELVVRGAAR